MERKVTISIVSHGQAELVGRLLRDIAEHLSPSVRVVLTINVPEADHAWSESRLPFDVEVIRNTSPKGFAANHNAAFLHAGGGLFCVVNPDIRIFADPFSALAPVANDPRVGVVAPVVVNPEGHPEDYARSFPSVFELCTKAFGRRPRVTPPPGASVFFPDWVAGMFMVFRAPVFHSLGGFDERYRLYYEDVDLCARLRDMGLEVAVCTEARVVHDAQRLSRRDLRYASWHLRSALRFFASRPKLALGIRSPR